jgi:hypothetical protein
MTIAKDESDEFPRPTYSTQRAQFLALDLGLGNEAEPSRGNAALPEPLKSGRQSGASSLNLPESTLNP